MEKQACPICPNHCLLSEGQLGLCGARTMKNGQFVNAEHGLLAAIHIDPIEKKPLYHFLPSTKALSIGSFGCNLKCRGCQNDSLSRVNILQAEGFKLSPDRIVQEAIRHQCPSIAYTYNEPIVWTEFVQETALKARESGLKNVVVTAGYVTDKARETLFQNIDAANVDLKGFTEKFYKTWASGSLSPVLETLEYLHHLPNFWLEITTLLIPKINTDPAELEAEFNWIYEHLGPDVPVHLSAFHPACEAQDIPRTPQNMLLMALKLAKIAGLHFVYLGNVPLAVQTSCPECGQTLIERMAYNTKIEDLIHGKCRNCGHQIPGYWSIM